MLGKIDVLGRLWNQSWWYWRQRLSCYSAKLQRRRILHRICSLLKRMAAAVWSPKVAPGTCPNVQAWRVWMKNSVWSPKSPIKVCQSLRIEDFWIIGGHLEGSKKTKRSICKVLNGFVWSFGGLWGKKEVWGPFREQPGWQVTKAHRWERRRNFCWRWKGRRTVWRLFTALFLGYLCH